MEPVVYVLLFVTSVVGFTFIVERGIALRWRRVVPSQVEAAVESCQAPEDVPMLRRVCQQHKSPTSRLLLIAAEHLDWPKAEAVDAIQSRARQEIARLERGLVVLEIIVGIAPLLGLLIAIPSLIFWSYYTKKVESIAVEMESLCDEFLRRQYREGVQSPKSKV